jgi:peptidoglycan/xylan/chitin deacetylase (PgdA/CDA1 family)
MARTSVQPPSPSHPLHRWPVSLCLAATFAFASFQCGGRTTLPLPETGSEAAAAPNDGGGPTASPPFEGPQNPECRPLGVPVDPGPYPQTDYSSQPWYIPNDVIVFTLDDGPQDTWTAEDLDVLKTLHLHVDFFVNTRVWSDTAQVDALLKRMLDEGHHIGNHTADHTDLVELGDAGAIESEITDVEQTVRSISGGAIPHLTRFRAPEGDPYEFDSGADMALVYPIVAKYAVHVAYNINSNDEEGAGDGPSLLGGVVAQIKTPGDPTGSWGVMLLHSSTQPTHDMLPLLIAYLRGAGFRLGTVEDVICWRFGKHSWELIPDRMPN